jgi:hypothetical protein
MSASFLLRHGPACRDACGNRLARTSQGNRANNQTSNAKTRRREKGPPRCQMDYIMAVRIADRNRKRPAIRTQARCLGGSWAPRRLGVVLLLFHPIALSDGRCWFALQPDLMSLWLHRHAPYGGPGRSHQQTDWRFDPGPACWRRQAFYLRLYSMGS